MRGGVSADQERAGEQCAACALPPATSASRRALRAARPPFSVALRPARPSAIVTRCREGVPMKVSLITGIHSSRKRHGGLRRGGY